MLLQVSSVDSGQWTVNTEAWVLGGAVELLSKMRKCAFKLRCARFQGLETRVATTHAAVWAHDFIRG